jgi:hypothetical protein
MALRREALGGLLWCVAGLAIAGWSATFPFGTLAEPGPALVPVACGAVLAALGAAVLMGSRRAHPRPGGPGALPGPPASLRMVTTCAAVAGAALALERAGFTATLFGLVFVLMWAVAGHRCMMAAAYAVVTAAACLVVFRLLLGVELPRGWLGL